jgi:hypothetical protein
MTTPSTREIEAAIASVPAAVRSQYEFIVKNATWPKDRVERLRGAGANLQNRSYRWAFLAASGAPIGAILNVEKTFLKEFPQFDVPSDEPAIPTHEPALPLSEPRVAAAPEPRLSAPEPTTDVHEPATVTHERTAEDPGSAPDPTPPAEQLYTLRQLLGDKRHGDHKRTSPQPRATPRRSGLRPSLRIRGRHS